MESENNSPEWISIEDRIPHFSTIVNVKTKSAKQLKAYFHHDRAFPLAQYWRNHKLSHWQEHEKLNWLYNVTHWRELNKNGPHF